MANAPPPSSRTFHPFPRLPAELRLEIWKCCIPTPGPCLYANPIFDTGFAATYIQQGRGPDPIDTSQWQITCPVPIAAQACQEATAAILRRTQIGAEGRKRLVVRAFDPDRDIIYMRFPEWTIMVHDRVTGRTALGMAVAVSEESFVDNPTVMATQLRHIGAIYVVDNRIPVLLGGCREIKAEHMAGWRWNRGERRFDYTAGVNEADLPRGDKRPFYERMNEAVQNLKYHSVLGTYLDTVDNVEVSQLAVVLKPSEQSRWRRRDVKN
ncbi:hypothetical protein K461DRAFT_272020 [Myriangium duriaei CBS 260.36]|uniref:2EXR domain-containing protein n=1 Tax=Myriangium duriaei CBS 260.36 TaxID=1168546 RepID=A0A9P4MI63_9PEZI|nr:hypothetical protein K461DRAFT_272020 [Myriangium duriaei CBS 260.36]